MRKTIFFILIYILFARYSLAEEDLFVHKRRFMVQEQIIKRGITDQKVIEAMYRVKRHLFVSPQIRDLAYEDRPLPIGYEQTISQPFIVAYMTQALRLKPYYKVLEIGTGSGYQAAVLAEIVKEVYTIEIIKPLAYEARERLKYLGYHNIKVKYADGYSGWPEYAPFDAIIVTAAPPRIPEKLIGQLKIGGKMIVPVGITYQQLYLITKTKDGYKRESLLPVRFVPMVREGRG